MYPERKLTYRPPLVSWTRLAIDTGCALAGPSIYPVPYHLYTSISSTPRKEIRGHNASLANQGTVYVEISRVGLVEKQAGRQVGMADCLIDCSRYTDARVAIIYIRLPTLIYAIFSPNPSNSAQDRAY